MWHELLSEKSIFSLFPADVLAQFSIEPCIRRFKSGEPVVSEGQPLNELLIPLSGEVILTQMHSSNVETGRNQPGRAIGLHSFLRSLPSPYTASAAEDIEVLALSRAWVESHFHAFPAVKGYIFKVTENATLRGLVKDLRELGISQDFISNFVNVLNEQAIQSYQFLLQRAQKPIATYFLVEGKFLCRGDGEKAKSWLMPLRSWVGWEACQKQSLAQLSVQALSNSVVLKCDAKDIQQLSENFPNEFAAVHRWIEQGQIAQNEDDSPDEFINDPAELFKDSKANPKRHLNFPWVKQNDEMDCGPACLAMISQFFGRELSVHFWRSRLSTDRNGTSLFDLAVTTERSGFISHCLEVTDLQEVDQFLFPFIAVRKYHYHVVYKVKKKSVIVGDPGIGIREIPLEEFYDGFESVGLFLKPNSDFYTHKDSPSPWRHYLQLFRGLESDMALALACSIIGVVISLAPPLISQIVLDEVMVRGDKKLLYVLLAAAFGVSILSSFVSWAESYYFVFIMGKFNFRATSVFIQKMLSLPYQFFSRRHVGDFTHRLSEMSHLRKFVTGTLFGVILNLITMFIYGGALYLINFKAAILVTILAPPLIFLPMLVSKYLSKIYGEIFSKTSEQYSFLTDLIKGVAAVKSMGAEMTARFRFEKRLLSLLQSENKYAMTSVNIETVTTGYHQLANFAVLGATVYLGIEGEMSAGKVISFSLIASRVFTPLLSLAKQWDHFIEMKSVLSRLNDIFLSPSDQTVSQKQIGRSSMSPLLGEIEFKDVWFRYGGEATDWVLKGVSFKIEKGQKVAIVGPSGSGKSTLAYLLARMYEPTKGQILIDGRDYREYQLDWLREQVGLLHQENFLFEGTLAENIALNSLDLDENRLKLAAERASATQLIEKKGDFFFHVPHGGLGFSGGEKQKIVLARLFYQDPSIVVLDEATSALDGIAEAEVLDHLGSEMNGHTVLNIAHRYSTVERSDLALVIADGKIVGFGSLEYLKQENLIFQKLFNISATKLSAKRAS